MNVNETWAGFAPAIHFFCVTDILATYTVTNI